MIFCAWRKNRFNVNSVSVCDWSASGFGHTCNIQAFRLLRFNKLVNFFLHLHRIGYLDFRQGISATLCYLSKVYSLIEMPAVDNTERSNIPKRRSLPCDVEHLRKYLDNLLKNHSSLVNGSSGKSLGVVIARFQGRNHIHEIKPDTDYLNRILNKTKALASKTRYQKVGFNEVKDTTISLPPILYTKNLMRKSFDKRFSLKLPHLYRGLGKSSDELKALYERPRFAEDLSAESIFSIIRCYNDILHDALKKKFSNFRTQRESTPVVNGLRMQCVESSNGSPTPKCSSLRPSQACIADIEQIDQMLRRRKISRRTTINQKLNEVIDMIDSIRDKKYGVATEIPFNDLINTYKYWNSTWMNIFDFD